MGQTIYECRHLIKERRATRKLIANAESDIKASQSKADQLKTDLGNANTEQQLMMLYGQITFLQEHFNAQKEYLIKLKLKELKLSKKIKNAGFVQLMDRSIGSSLCALGIIGLIVSLYFPMAGLGILTAISAISLAYLIIRLAVPLLQLLGKWIASMFKPAAVEGISKDNLEQTYEHKKESSTDLMIECFFGNKKSANEFLKKPPKKMRIYH